MMENATLWVRLRNYDNGIFRRYSIDGGHGTNIHGDLTRQGYHQQYIGRIPLSPSWHHMQEVKVKCM